MEYKWVIFQMEHSYTCSRGATPKDGPSTGITMFTLCFFFTGRKVKKTYFMSGEIT